jgi:hypothetical protein
MSGASNIERQRLRHRLRQFSHVKVEANGVSDGQLASGGSNAVVDPSSVPFLCCNQSATRVMFLKSRYNYALTKAMR